MEAELNNILCPNAKKCGGCRWQGVPYARQLEIKEAEVRRLMGKYCRVAPIWGMEQPLHYRNKVQAAFGTDRHGRVISGVYQSGSHRIVPTDECMLEDLTADRIIADIRRMMPKFKMTAYDERRRSGFLRHVLVRRGFATDEVMAVLVSSTPIFPAQKAFTAALLEQHPEITTLVLNINDAETSLVLGQREKVLFGRGYIEDVLCGNRFRISPRSFYQVNPVQTEKLYRAAIDFAALTGRERVLDAYCGTGTIALCAAGAAGEVAGVELNRDAVRDAIANARANGVHNCRFTCADAGAFLEEAAAEGERCDVVFMDPPRAGSDLRFLRSLLRAAPARIVYISCNPETLARDTAVLAKGGYSVRRVQPVDMFPFTEHVETVVLMSRLGR
ncbi:MAG: 23S rRNA (uracil(1939)-C(5))-methyltransferase RlmD [Oscillospiraceae bacterium]|nr:23S rRNA (uracil(1939)-C(5))-methyltransferase RlmD [Oscillospiraceae bacterium]